MGTWNVRTLLKPGKLHLLLKELEANDVDIVGLSEIRWQGEGHFQSGDSIVIFSGGIRGQGGVAMILNKKLRGTMISYNPVSERILVVRLAMRPVNVTVVVVWNTLTVLMTVSTTIPLHQDPLDVDVAGLQGMQ